MSAPPPATAPEVICARSGCRHPLSEHSEFGCRANCAPPALVAYDPTQHAPCDCVAFSVPQDPAGLAAYRAGLSAQPATPDDDQQPDPHPWTTGTGLAMCVECSHGGNWHGESGDCWHLNNNGDEDCDCPGYDTGPPDDEPPMEPATAITEALDQFNLLADEHWQAADPLAAVADAFNRWAVARADELTVRQACPHGCTGGHTQYEYDDAHRNDEGGY